MGKQDIKIEIGKIKEKKPQTVKLQNKVKLAVRVERCL